MAANTIWQVYIDGGHSMQNTSVTEEIGSLVRKSLLGHEEAILYVLQAFDTMHVLDDLIDGDRDVSAEELSRRMFHALITMPNNQFYRDNQGAISGVLITGWANWIAANKTEQSYISDECNNEEGLRVSFVTRSTYMDLITLCAVIVGGLEHGASVAKEVREYCTSEGFDAYLNALKQERRRN